MPSAYLKRLALLARAAVGPSLEDRLADHLRLERDTAVLDVGAGDGALLLALRRRGHAGRLVAVEPAVPDAPDAALEWHGASATALPFPDGAFGAVLLVRVLLHVERRGVALREALRVRRPGGRVIVALNGEAHLATFWQFVRAETAGSPEWQATLNSGRAGVSAEVATRDLLEQYGAFTGGAAVSAPVHFRPEDVTELLGTYRQSFLLDDSHWSLGLDMIREAARSTGGVRDQASLACFEFA